MNCTQKVIEKINLWIDANEFSIGSDSRKAVSSKLLKDFLELYQNQEKLKKSVPKAIKKEMKKHAKNGNEIVYLKKNVMTTEVPKIKNGWQKINSKFEKNKLPEEAVMWAKKRDVFRGGGNVVAVYCQGDLKDPSDWILVTDDGGFYKAGAKYIIWKGDKYAFAVWSTSYLETAIQDLIDGKEIVRDPLYQT